jgi:hypothetical protein
MMIEAFHVLIGGGGWEGAEPVMAAAESPGSVLEAVVVAIRSRGLLSVSQQPPILLNGCLHWACNNSVKDGILIFDTMEIGV